MQSNNALDLAGQQLARAWLTDTPLASGQLQTPIASDDDARVVQQALWRQLEPQRTRPGGWKVGAKGPQAPVGEAPLPASGLLSSGAQVGGAGFRMRGVELELALRLGSDVGAEASDARIVASIDAVCSAIELVETRLADWETAPAEARFADLQSHRALVLGPWVPRSAALPDLRAVRARLAFDGAVIAETLGGNPAQDLPRLLRTLAARCAARGLPLQAGQVITTGACTGLVFAPPGTTVHGQIDTLPPVTLRFGD